MKTCSKCKIEKEFSEFSKNNKAKDKLNYCCKMCQKEYNSRPDIVNRRSIQSKEYHSRPDIKEKRRFRAKIYNSKPEIKEKTSARVKEYNSRPEAYENKKKYNKEYESRPNIREKRYLRQKLYRNTPEIKEKRSIQQKERLSSDINYLLKCKLRTRLNSAIKGNYKSGSAVSDLGCSIEDFKKYLESKFQDDMSWDNYNKHGWHIDHIIPLSSFDLTDREQLLKACHYTNLQPLWAKDNLSKSNKIL